MQGIPNVVVLGGGTGMPVLLRGLKSYPINLSAIVTVADDGGSTGRLREYIDMPAPGDIRNTIVALADMDEELEALFQYRFKENRELAGHALGNLVLAAMSSDTGDFYTGIKILSELLGVKGNIYPLVNEPAILHAVMDDGSIVSGESKIQLEHKKINKVYLTPDNLKPMPEVVTSILNADIIVISPGSLYTSILPNLVITEVVQALKNTTAQVVYVCNIMTQDGETNNYTVLDHLIAIQKHVGANVVDSIIVHNKTIQPEIIARYAAEKAIPVTYDLQKLQEQGLEVIEADIAEFSDGALRHNTNLIAEIIFNIVKKNRN